MVEVKNPVMFKRLVLAFLLIASAALCVSGQKRTAAGVIYFTNNTPPDLRTFPVEILTPNKKKVIAATLPDEQSRFAFQSIKPGRYLLRLTWANRCVLWYRMDLSRESKPQIRVIMDLDCAHSNGKIQDLPAN